MIMHALTVNKLSTIGVGEGGVSFRKLLVFSSDLNIFEEYNLIINIPCVVEMVDNILRYVTPQSLVPSRDNPRWSKNS